MAFDFRPIADALAERGRVVVGRAYADWSFLDEDRRMLTRSHVCPVCFWEDDGDDLDRVGGANGDLTLAQARRNYAAFGACTERRDNTDSCPKLELIGDRQGQELWPCIRPARSGATFGLPGYRTCGGR